METKQVIDALGALAQSSRLAIYRLLVEPGPEGLAAGAIAEKLDLPAATLSFHLAHLSRASLVQGRQDGRFVIYSVNFQSMNALVGFLTDNCCEGATCAPAACETPTPSTRKERRK